MGTSSPLRVIAGLRSEWRISRRNIVTESVKAKESVLIVQRLSVCRGGR